MTEKYLPFDGLHEECGVFGIYAVSYTHLDVYKRQEQGKDKKLKFLKDNKETFFKKGK